MEAYYDFLSCIGRKVNSDRLETRKARGIILIRKGYFYRCPRTTIINRNCHSKIRRSILRSDISNCMAENHFSLLITLQGYRRRFQPTAGLMISITISTGFHAIITVLLPCGISIQQNVILYREPVQPSCKINSIDCRHIGSMYS